MTLLSCVAREAAATSSPASKRIITGLHDYGYAVVDDWLPDALVGELAHTCRALAGNGALDAAGIGQGPLRVEDPHYRQTWVRWIEPPTTGAEAQWLDHCEQLRERLNEHLFLGLFDFECHYSIYPVGGFYRRHVDRFITDDRRSVSCVVYLNEAWTDADGGALRLYGEPGDEGASFDVLPARGRFVAFLSDRFPHEVLPTRRERLAIAGWFRRRPLGSPIT